MAQGDIYRKMFGVNQSSYFDDAMDWAGGQADKAKAYGQGLGQGLLGAASDTLYGQQSTIVGDEAAPASSFGGITTQTNEMDYLAGGYGATWDADKGMYTTETGETWEPPSWEMLDEYQTSGAVQKQMSQLDALSGRQAAMGGKYMSQADQMLAGGSDYARKIAQEQQMGIQAGSQQQMRQAEQTAAMTGVDAGQSSLLKSVMASGTGEQMRQASVSAEQQAQSMGLQQAQLGQGLLGQAAASRTQLLAAQQQEQGAKEARYEDIVELKNTMAGAIRDEKTLTDAEREANLSSYNALTDDELRLSQYTDDSGGQLYENGKNIHSGKTFQEEFLSGKIATGPGVSKSYEEIKVTNSGGGGIMGDIEGIWDSTAGRAVAAISTFGGTEAARYGADKGMFGQNSLLGNVFGRGNRYG